MSPSPDRETRRDTLDRTREELHILSLCKYYNKLLYLFKPIVHIISFISFHGILSLDYPYIIATSGYIMKIDNFTDAVSWSTTSIS